MANTLNLGTGGNWAAKEGSLLAYNNENGNFKPLPFDFTRASSATRVNSQGLIEVVGSDQPRVDYSSGEGALLLEPSRTNIIPYSEDFSNAAWTKFNTTVTADQEISPDGTNTAYEIESTNASHLLYVTSTVSQSTKYIFSFFFKEGTINDTKIAFYDDTANSFISQDADKEVIDYSNGWKRFITEVTTPSGCTSLFSYIDRSSEVGSFYAWGAQLERSSYATSYIPTQGAAVTRVAEDAVNTLTNQIIDSTKVVFYNEFNISEVATSRITLSDNSYNNGVLIETRSDNTIRGYIRVAGVILGMVSSSTLNLLSFNKVAIKFDGTSCYLYVNGIFAGSALTGSTFSVNTLNTLRYDRGDGSASAKFYGNIKETKIYNTALTDAELIALTTI